MEIQVGSNCRFVRSSVLTACIFALVSVPIADAVHAQSPKQANTTTRATAKAKAKSPWESVVVLGASASAGFNPTTFSNGVSVAQALDELIKEEHKVTDASDFMFFVSPSRTGAKLIKKAEAAKPSLVVALDFLFWYAYGKKPTEQRFKDLDAGFKLLERFDCPIVITRLPDMSPAIGKMLSAEQVPAKDVLGKLNKSLEAWSKKQKNIVVAPLVKFLDDARDGKAIKIGQAEWPKGSKKLLLHADELHPTTEGVVALAYLALH
ncbi:MAG: hypothetical protein V3U11_00990, partial [Planctomycetota bacterium]